MTQVADRYYDWIRWIVDETWASDDTLHVHAGLIVLLLARLITGRGLGSFVPFAVVVLAQLANEGLDRLAHGSWRWSDTGRDTLLTLAWPLLLSLIVRLRPARG